MWSFKVNGSCTLAAYQRGTLMLYHHSKIYKLETPLERAQVDKLSIGSNDQLHVFLKDESKLVLQPMSRTEAAEFHAKIKLDLRALQKRHAMKAQLCAKMLKAAAKKLVRVQKQLEDDAVAITGEAYPNLHTVSYELHGTNDQQVERDGFVTAPDFESVFKMADELDNALEPVVGAAEPLPLLCECDGSDSADSE